MNIVSIPCELHVMPQGCGTRPTVLVARLEIRGGGGLLTTNRAFEICSVQDCQ